MPVYINTIMLTASKFQILTLLVCRLSSLLNVNYNLAVSYYIVNCHVSVHFTDNQQTDDMRIHRTQLTNDPILPVQCQIQLYKYLFMCLGGICVFPAYLYNMAFAPKFLVNFFRRNFTFVQSYPHRGTHLHALFVSRSDNIRSQVRHSMG